MEKNKIKLTYEDNAEWLIEVAALANSCDGELSIKIDLKDNVVRTKNFFPTSLLAEMIDENIKPKPEYEISSVTNDLYKIINIKVYKGKNVPYYLSRNKDIELYIKVNEETVKIKKEEFLKLFNTDDLPVLPYENRYGNFHYLEEKFRQINIYDVDFEGLGLVKNGMLTYPGYCFSEAINNRISLFCRKYRNTFLHSKVRYCMFEDEVNGDIISMIEHAIKFVKDLTYIQRVSIEDRPKFIKDYSLELFKKLIVESFIEQDFRVNKDIYLDLYDDRIVIGSWTSNNKVIEKKIILNCLAQMNIINIDTYHRTPSDIMVEYENYKYDLFDEIISIDPVGNTVTKTMLNYNYKCLHMLPEDPKSSLELDNLFDRAVLTLLRESCEHTVKDMAMTLRVREGTIRNCIRRLVSKGYIQQVGRGYFKLF